MRLLIGVLLVIHGLIVASQSTGSFGPGIPNEVENPAFMQWWPVNMGRSWLVSSFGMERTLTVYRIGGVLWLVGGMALVAAGLSLLGLIIPSEWWRALAVAGGSISLVMLLIYFHPLMIIGIASSLAILVALLVLGWPPASLVR